MDHRLHEGDRIMPSEEGEARPDHRLAKDMPVLLGQIPARAQPAARCHDHGCDLPCHSLDPKNDVGSWLSASRLDRKLAFHPTARGSDQDGDFCTAALAHLPGLAKLYAARK